MVARLTNVPSKQELHKLYIVDRMSMTAIAKMWGCSPISIGRLVKRYGIPARKTGPLPGHEHPEWKGGIRMCKGYVYRYCPDHPHATKHGKAVAEHRLVMEKHLGRYLLPSEVVHHINGDPLDNRIENLELHENNAAHLRSSLKGKCPKWTKQGLANIRKGVTGPKVPRPPTEEVVRLYVDEGLSIEKVADKLQSSRGIVTDVLDKAGIQRRSPGYPKYNWPSPEVLYEMYLSLPLKDVCSAVGGCTQAAIYSFLNKHGLPTAKSQSRTKARNSGWRHQAKSKCQEPTEYSDSP